MTKRSYNPFRIGLALAPLAAVVWSGCGTDRLELAPVSGSVSYRGQPVEGAVVTFIAEGAPRYSSGTTNAEGEFSLSTYAAGDGAHLGTNAVTIVMTPKISGDIPATPTGEEYARILAEWEQAAATGLQLPDKYARPESSGLTAHVAGGGSRHDFDLTD